jgi:hypothetical protein
MRADVEGAGARARTACRALNASGVSVTYERAVFVPGDEAIFHLFSSDALEAVRRASVEAGLVFERIVEWEAVYPRQELDET